MSRCRVLFIILTLPAILMAQPRWDTLKYVKYNSRLIIGLYQSYREFNIDVGQKLLQDSVGISNANYTAETRAVTGIDVNYDKFGFSFGFRSTPPTDQNKKGYTKYRTLGFNFGGNKWICEASYRMFDGFYDSNTSRYDTSFKTTGVYYQSPSLLSESYKVKFAYFTNHKRFSFKSAYGTSYRQLKTAATWILYANMHYNKLNSDSSFVPYPIRSYYPNYSDMNGLNVMAFGIYGGGSINLVAWRCLFLNMTLVVGPEQQWRRYHYQSDDHVTRLFYLAASGDFRMALGLNMRRFYFMLSSTTDFIYYSSNQVKITSSYVGGNLSLGYRFYLKTPKLYEQFQKTKLYRIF